MIQVIDDFLLRPREFRAMAAGLEYRTYEFPEATFHGISLSDLIRGPLEHRFPKARPNLCFFRKSPLGQVEPHFIHTDADMGEWSAILYLNENPPEGDGTNFWNRTEINADHWDKPHEFSEEGKSSEGWRMRQHVSAKFNRLILFPSTYFHSRALFDNWGDEREARLTAVAFGTGDVSA